MNCERQHVTQPKPRCSCWCQCVVTQPKPWCSCWCQCVVTQPKPWCSCWCQCVVTLPKPWCSCWCQCVVTQPKPCCSCWCQRVVWHSPSLAVLAGVSVLCCVPQSQAADTVITDVLEFHVRIILRSLHDMANSTTEIPVVVSVAVGKGCTCYHLTQHFSRVDSWLQQKK